MTLALARAEVCVFAFCCVCVGVAFARDACSLCLLSFDNCNPPFLSYLVRSYSSRKPACMPVSHDAASFSLCCTPKIHTSFALLLPFPRRLSFSHPLCCACQTYPRRAQCGRQPKAFLKCICADTHTCKQNANICTLFPQDAVAAVNTDETGGNCSLRPEEAATVYLDETVQVSIESSVRLSLSLSKHVALIKSQENTPGQEAC